MSRKAQIIPEKTCIRPGCGVRFAVKGGPVRAAARKYCSKECAGIGDLDDRAELAINTAYAKSYDPYYYGLRLVFGSPMVSL